MPRIRTIKPEFWTDEKVVELSPWARLLFIGLWNFADDNGVLERKPKQIKMRIFPGDNIEIEPLLEEIEKINLIHTYTVDDQNYLILPNLSKHQVIDKPRKTNLPLPDSLEINRNQLKSTEIMLGREGKRKGKEGKGKKEKIYKKEKSQPPQKTTLPPDFKISPEVIAWAKAHGHKNLEAHLEAFIDVSRAKGYQYVDWDSAFKKAVRENWGKINGDSKPDVEYCCRHPDKKSYLVIDDKHYCRDCVDDLDKPPKPEDIKRMNEILQPIVSHMTTTR